MIKQPPQILKFFSSVLEVERDWNRKLHGTPGRHIITEDRLFIPPFQIKFNFRGEDITDFTVIELVNYETRIATDISGYIQAMGVFNHSSYQNFVVPRFPLEYLLPAGNYYLRIADGDPGEPESNEIWYSEVFQLCDITRNLLRSVTFTGWEYNTSVNVLTTEDKYIAIVCETGGSGPYFLMDQFYVIESEPLDFYALGKDPELGELCGEDTFLPLYFALVDEDLNVISNVISGIEGAIKGRFTPTKTCPAHLMGWVDTEIVSPVPGIHIGESQWELVLNYANPQLYSGDFSDPLIDQHENIGSRPVIRWSNSCNICDMIYEILDGYIGEQYWTMAYENYLILDAVKDDEQNYGPSIVPQFEIEETVKEDDVFNKYNIVGVQKEWYALQLVTSEQLAKSIQKIHLHNTVELAVDGEALILAENRSELSAANDYNVMVKFIFREETCPVEACCFDVCCPNLENADNIEIIGGGCATLGRRVIASDGLLYECNGATWDERTTEEVDGNCIYVEDFTLGCQYWYWNTDGFYAFAEIDTVTDNTDGTANINILDNSKAGVMVQCQYSLDGVTWTDCGDPYEITGSSDVILCECGAGVDTIFRLHVYEGDCDYGYSNEVIETIT